MMDVLNETQRTLGTDSAPLLYEGSDLLEELPWDQHELEEEKEEECQKKK